MTFRLVPRQDEPSLKQVKDTVKRVEPQTITKVQPLPPETVKKTEPEVIRQTKPQQPVPAPVKVSGKSRTEPSVSEPKKVVVRETPPVVRQPDDLKPEMKFSPEDSRAFVPEPPVESGETGILGMVMAKPLYRVNPPPPYPAKAQRRNLEGTVILKVSVSAEGKVDQLQIKESCGHNILDKAALAAVREWVFEPGSLNGVHVSMTVLVPVRFRLQ